MHLAFLAKLARELGLGGLSMGMSADFETAIAFGATHARVGSEIFGTRGDIPRYRRPNRRSMLCSCSSMCRPAPARLLEACQARRTSHY